MKIHLGVSSCLLGNPVRYDGQHQRNRFLCEQLAQYVDYVPVCPEVECGLGVPREAMHLVGNPVSPRLMTVRTQCDMTDRMRNYLSGKLDALALEKLDGFVFKKDSPSSGLERVRVYDLHGIPAKTGRGFFAGAFTDRFPDLPVIEDGMLNDRFLRERFLNRIFTAGRWNETEDAEKDSRWLSDFQARHKLMLMSHAPQQYAQLGRLIELGDTGAYRRKLNQLMSLLPSVRKHVNVLHHILGYFKKDLTAWEKTEVLESIERYRIAGTLLAVPLTLLRHYSRKFGKDYLLRQTYWELLDGIYA